MKLTLSNADNTEILSIIIDKDSNLTIVLNDETLPTPITDEEAAKKQYEKEIGNDTKWYDNDETLPTPITDEELYGEASKKQYAEFVYEKEIGNDTKWYRIELIDDDKKYLTGYDMNDNRQFKRFLKDKIIGGKIIWS